MKLAIVSLVAILAIAAPLPVQTDAFDGFIDSLEGRNFDLFVDAPGWKFFRTAAYCYAVEENGRGTLLFRYDQRRDQVHLAFWNVNLTSYNTADTTNLELIFFTIIPGQGVSAANRDWGFHKYVVATNRDGRRVFNTKLNGQAALRAFSRFDVLSIVTANGDIVQSFRLAQSSHALRRLAACRPH